MTPLYDPNAWYIDCDGRIHFLVEHAPEDVLLENRGSYNEVSILAAPDAEGPGRFVLDTYVLHASSVTLGDLLRAG